MKHLIKKYTRLLGLSLFVAIPLFADTSYEVADEVMAIIKVYDEPVGFQSESIYGGNGCMIGCSISPMMKKTKVQLGEILRIQVVDGKDITVLCNGDKGITITRH